jgi:hypothetical protein
MEPPTSQLIVQMVSPAVMLSACGLMLLGLGNRYGRIVDRIRDFATEWRALKKATTDFDRLHTLEVQLSDLFRRGQLLRNAVMLFYVAIFLFVVCSFAIPVTGTKLPLLFFCTGMACVLTGTLFALRETLLSFRLIKLDVSTAKG